MENPPRLGRALARWLAASWRRDEIDADLVESWRRRRGQRGARRAFWRDVFSIVQLRQSIEIVGGRRSPLRMGDTMQNLKLAIRLAIRQPGVAALTVLTLALGVGASTSVFSLAYGIWLKPLPYANASRLAVIHDVHRASGADAGAISQPEAADYRAGAPSIADIAVYSYGAAFIRVNDDQVRVLTYRATPNLFSVLGAYPAIGRVFTPEDAAGVNGQVAVLSDHFWRSRLGADPNIVGKSLTMNYKVTVLGVMPRDFRFPQVLDADLWIPMTADVSGIRSQRYTQAIGVLAPGASFPQAQSELAAAAARVAAAYPDTNRGWSAEAKPLIEDTVGGYRDAFGTLLAAASVLLLIACSNVTSVLMARYVVRRHELAARAALGASRTQLAAQIITESLFLSSLGGIVGVAVTFVGLPLLANLMPRFTPRAADLRIDAAVLVFAVAATLLAGLLCGLVPALRLTRPSPSALQSGSRSIVGGQRIRGHRVLVVVEVALSMVLLLGGGLMMKSFFAIMNRDRGFTSDHLLTMHMVQPFDRASERQTRARVTEDALAEVRRLPDVVNAAAVTGFPSSSLGVLGGWAVAADASRPADRVWVTLRAADEAYFSTMQTPVMEGRAFDQRDTTIGSPVLIINRTLAKRLWPNESAVGKRVPVPTSVQILADAGATFEVIGVASDMHVGATATPEVFVPLAQSVAYWTDIVVRTKGEPGALATAVRTALRSSDDKLIIEEMTPMTRVLTGLYGLQRAQGFMVALFAGLAGILAAIGLYSLLSYSVSQRIPEIGVRLALGATPERIFRSILLNGLVMSVSGVVFGSICAAAIIYAVRSRVFGLKTIDPWVLAAAPLILIATSVAASYFPARKALRIDPMQALK